VSIAIVGTPITGNGATIANTGVTAGSLLTLQTAYFRAVSTLAAETVPTDSQGTWSTGAAGQPGHDTGQDVGASIFYQASVAAGTHTVTPEANGSKQLCLTEWSGATSTPLDGTANAHTDTFTGASQVTGTTATLAQSDELVLIVNCVGAQTGLADIAYTDPVSGFTTLQKTVNDLSSVALFAAYKQAGATTAQSATFNWVDSEPNQYSGAAIATFKASAAAGGNVLMGRSIWMTA
jgi:hypothetical protein